MKIAFESVPSEFVSATASYDYKEPISEALATIHRNGAVIVTKDGEYYGIVDNRMVVRNRMKISKSHAINKYAVKLPVLDSSTSIEKAIHQFYSSGAKALPYYEGKKVTGVVHRRTMLKAILSLHLLSKYKANEVMSTPVMAVDPDTSLSNARAIMKKNNINRLIVIADGKAKGILTYKNIMEQMGNSPDRMPERKGSVRQDARVIEVAEDRVLSVRQDDSVEDAIREMVENKISSLLVTKGGAPIGVMTVRDIFEAVATNAAGADENIIISGLDDYTEEFKDEILTELEKLEDRINKFHKMNVANITLNVKRHRAKNYEMKLRVWLTKRGVISTASTGFELDTTLNDTISKVYNTIKEKKEIVYSERRNTERGYNDEE